MPGKDTKPFPSKAALRTCFWRQHFGMNGKWDCVAKLKATPDVACLPERAGGKKGNCRKQRVGEPVIGKVMTGPRSGKYFMVEGIKVYVTHKPTF